MNVVFDFHTSNDVAHTKNILRHQYLEIHKQNLSPSTKHFLQNPVQELSVENKHRLKEHAYIVM